MKQVNLPEDLEGPNDKFFSHPMVQTYLATAGTNETIDWNKITESTVPGDYSKLHKKLLDVTNTIIKKGARGYFWLVCSPEMGDVLASIKSFVPTFVEQYALGYPIIMFMGILDKRWRIYTDVALPNQTMLLGTGFSKKHVNFYANITVENFTN